MSGVSDLSAPVPSADGSADAMSRAAAEQRVLRAVAAHSAGVWRTLRRLGVSAADADDGVQQVFSVFARRLATIPPGAERGFLFSAALRVAAEQRRRFLRRERPLEYGEHDSLDDGRLSPEELLEQRRKLEMLDRLLTRLPQAQRQVLILCELEGLTLAEAGQALRLPAGTVASRLHRARQRFAALCRAVGGER